MGKLLILFVVVPAVELALLVEIGSRIGTAETFLLILATGALGASLARHQGLRVLRQLEQEMRTGQMPGATLIDGAMVIVAGALLVTPGILTDLFGFFCLVPATRRPLRAMLQGWLAQHVQTQASRTDVRFTTGAWESRSGPIHDITPEHRSGESSSEEPASASRPGKGA